MALPSFHEVLFPEDISYGSSGGPGFNTTVIELANGNEQRNVNWSLDRAQYDVSHGVKTREQMEHLLEFFKARRGKAYGFRFKDWMDFTLDRQPVGTTDGGGAITQQIFKRYEPETDFFYDRPLKRLVAGTITVWVNGAVWPNGFNHVDPGTGMLTAGGAQSFDANAVVEVACEFHVPVRFDIDEMKITHDDFELMSWPSIPLVELRL